MARELLRLGDKLAIDPTRLIAVVMGLPGMRARLYLEGGSEITLEESETGTFRAWLNGPQDVLRLSGPPDPPQAD